MVKRQNGITIGDAFSMFMSSKVNISKPTADNYALTYRVFLRDNGLEENFPTKTVTEQLVNDWINSMKETTRVTTINHYVADIRVFLNFCMREGYIRKFTVSAVKGQESIVKFYSDDDISALLKKPSKSELFTQYRTWVVICFILATGARASTLVNIKISDIDFKNGEIIYRHLKNKRTAVIPLSPSLSRILKEYLSLWGREKEDGYIFCDMKERKCTPNSLYQALENYCKRRGVENKGLHALRHSFAREYIVNGGNAFKLQKLLTHSSLEMTKKYVRLFNDDLKEDFESPLDRKLGGKIHRN